MFMKRKTKKNKHKKYIFKQILNKVQEIKKLYMCHTATIHSMYNRKYKILKINQ